MKVLGITMESNSSAAGMKDGEIVCAVSEERFNKIKNYCGYPKKSVEYCKSVLGDIDKVVFATLNGEPVGRLTHFSTRTIQEHILEQEVYWLPKLYDGEKINYLDVFPERADYDQYPGPEFWMDLDYTSDKRFENWREARKQIVKKHLGIENVEFFEHHRCHSMYAYYASPFRKKHVLSFTADGWGDYSNASVSMFNHHNEYLKLYETQNMLLGRLYRFITLILGIKPWEGEYKVMGLAPYASEYHWKKPYEIFKELLEVDGTDIKLRTKPKDFYYHWKEKLEGYRFDGIAGGLQKYLEEILTTWVKNWVKETGIDHIVFSGGVAMNCKAMMEIAKLPEVKNIFIPPSGADESLALGACYTYAHENYEGKIKPLNTTYLGPQYEEDKPSKDRQRIKLIAKKIEEGKVVAVYLGRMEFGARALGNRSILADPRNPDIVKIINNKIKNRDFWMPFAPVILHERVKDYLINQKNIDAPFMTIAFETTTLGRKHLKAALHPADMTCRPQIIKREHNPVYYDIIKEFEKLTGIGGLLNTSFNLHGYPIVRTPDDATDVFKNSDLDLLFMNDLTVEKRMER